MEKISVCKTTDVEHGKMIKVSVNGIDILIVNVNGNYFATDDTCTHSGASLSEGKLKDGVITCDWHAAEFDCKNGKLVKFPVKIRDLTVYQVTIESNNILIEM